MLRRTLSVPIVAIGGINAGNAAALVRAGADGVAVVSAIMAADDPRTASAELLAAVRAAQTRDQ
jgi:thiamine-phosphate pyrophosphorylase